MKAFSRAASLVSAALLFLPAMLPAQPTVHNEHTPPQRATAQMPGQHPTGPTVNPDRTVTFHFPVPGAKEVLLDLEGADPQPMTQGADGVWTLTTTPLEPELYGYGFRADGIAYLDPGNVTSSPTCSACRTKSKFPGRSRWIGTCRTSLMVSSTTTFTNRKHWGGERLLRLHAAGLQSEEKVPGAVSFAWL